MRCAYIGNFTAPHSTENELAKAMTANGITVHQMQESEPASFIHAVKVQPAFILWTSTKGLLDRIPVDLQEQMLAGARAAGIPVVSYHLDIWHGLARQHLVDESLFFRTDLVCTADGGHEAEFAASGVNHRWFPPGVSEFECVGGQRKGRYIAPITFVGSWQGGYHEEHAHRAELVKWLTVTYRSRVRFWPRPGAPAVRSEALRDLYASTKVVVGDSCFAGRLPRYCSDRIPETLGRGGFLLHPEVEGVTDGSLYTAGEHLDTWPAGDWPALKGKIDYYLAHENERNRIAAAGRAHVLAHHTYTVRVRQLLELLTTEGYLDAMASA